MEKTKQKQSNSFVQQQQKGEKHQFIYLFDNSDVKVDKNSARLPASKYLPVSIYISREISCPVADKTANADTVTIL